MKNKPRSALRFSIQRVLIVPGIFAAALLLMLIGRGIFSSAEARSPYQANAGDNRLNAGALAPTGPPCATLAYISNTGSNTVSVIDTASNTVAATMSAIGTSPGGVAVNPAGTRVYVTNRFNDRVSVIVTSTNMVVHIVELGLQRSPLGLAVTPDGSRVYVANFGNGVSTVSVIDTSTNFVVDAVQGLFNPYGVAVKPDGTRVYVTNSGHGSFAVIDTSTNTVITTVGVVGFPRGIAVSPDGARVYVAGDSGNTLTVIETTQLQRVATVPVGSSPYGVAVNPAGTRVYVANSASNNVSVVDTSTNTVVATVPVGSQPTGVSVTPDGTRVYVANYLSNTVSVIDASSNTVVATVPAGMYPNAFGNFIASVPCPSPTPTPTPTPPPHPCQLRVLIVYADALPPAEFQWQIQNEPNVAAVDLFYARDATPTLAQLQQYDIVVPLSYANTGFQNAKILGNNLADYVDRGGVVVQYGLTYRPANNQAILGRCLSEDYAPYYYLFEIQSTFRLGTFNAAHPLMANVTALNNTTVYDWDLDQVAPLGATEVAQTNHGDSLIAVRQVRGGHTTIAVAGYVGDLAFQSGDWWKVVVNAGNWLYNCEPGPILPPSQDCRWQLVSPMPVDVYGAAGASDGAYFYAAGGYSFTQPAPHTLNVLNRWSPNPPPYGSWTAQAPMPQRTVVATAVYYPPTNKIYVFGGIEPDSDVVYNITQIYDIASNTWSTGAPMPDVRTQSAGGYSPATGRIYIISGGNTASVTSAQPNTWAYDPVADLWTDLTGSAPFPHPAGGFAYGVINNKLYLAGGRDGNNQRINLTWEYDPVANTYTQKADEPDSFQNNVPGSVVAGGRLWVFGGGNPFGPSEKSDSALPPIKPRSDISQTPSPSRVAEGITGQALPDTADDGRYYDPASDSWSSAPKLAIARSFPCSGAIGDDLLIAAGGYNGTTSAHTVQTRNVCIGAPTLTSAVSRKTHGVAGNFDVDLPLTGAPAIECRTGGTTNDYTIVVTFLANVEIDGGASVTAGTGVIGSGGVSNGGAVTTRGNVVTIPLTNVANAQTLTLQLNAVNGSTNLTIPVRLLIGDTNGDGLVNSGDAQQTRNRSGQTTDATNFRSDVDADGVINSGDATVVRARSGTSLP